MGCPHKNNAHPSMIDHAYACMLDRPIDENWASSVWKNLNYVIFVTGRLGMEGSERDSEERRINSKDDLEKNQESHNQSPGTSGT